METIIYSRRRQDQKNAERISQGAFLREVAAGTDHNVSHAVKEAYDGGFLNEKTGTWYFANLGDEGEDWVTRMRDARELSGSVQPQTFPSAGSQVTNRYGNFVGFTSLSVRRSDMTGGVVVEATYSTGTPAASLALTSEAAHMLAASLNEMLRKLG